MARRDLSEAVVKKGQIGLLFFLASEVMFFAGLFSAYWVLRAQTGVWPPIGQPRLPIGITGANTAILLLSAVTIWRADIVQKKGCYICLVGWLALTGLGGAVFLGIQGYEWLRLIRFGLSTTHSIYAGTFYLIVGAHGLHLLAALIVLSAVLLRAARHRYEAPSATGVSLCRTYWTFVVALWPVIYVALYLL
ncbi:MAG: heme-copper oxidase subunit III [Deltaproteobacteria bacterium]|nr:heme-copper oxidase subunit III [Deltaproteobacteria bacterium]MBI4373403.1 heme-copper oxidase subunit III [Deltaproteobacteria bacterium]